MATWPATLPQTFRLAGFNILKQPGTIRGTTDYGPQPQRNRFSAAEELAKGSMIVTAAQYAILRTFYDDTLFNGASVFVWAHPITGATANARFKADEAQAIVLTQVLKDDLYLINMTVEFLP